MKIKISKSFLNFLGYVLVAGSPFFAFAQRAGGIKDLMLSVGAIVTLLIPLSATAALLFFFWGLAKFILKLGRGEESAVEEGKEIMKWGIVSLFVIVSIWGIVSLIQADLGIPPVQDLTSPALR